MKQLKVQITSSAEADLNEIQFYLETHAGLEIAETIIQAVLDRIDLLESMPNLGKKRDGVLDGVRSITEGKYVIYYEVTDKELLVTRVLHASMDRSAYFNHP